MSFWRALFGPVWESRSFPWSGHAIADQWEPYSVTPVPKGFAIHAKRRLGLRERMGQWLVRAATVPEGESDAEE